MVFWVVMLHSDVVGYQQFGGHWCLLLWGVVDSVGLISHHYTASQTIHPYVLAAMTKVYAVLSHN